MDSRIRNCKNCQGQFTLKGEDFDFYEKIEVPPPTFCPDCRLQRRMVWRNDWHLYYKKEALTGKKIFSIFPGESPVKIYDRDYWWSDDWDPLDYGREYDFSRPFFEQFNELRQKVPFPAHSMVNMVDCKYCTNANNCKGCYLVRGASYTEDSAYLIWDQSSKKSLDSHMTNRCELSYGNVNTAKCYNTLFSVDCEDCHDVILSKDCVGCNNCFGSVGLRKKSYMIFNKQYTKDEYFEKLQELKLGSYKSFEELRKRAYAFWDTIPHKFIHGLKNQDVTGDYIYESKNVTDSFRVRGVEDSKYIQNILTGPVKDCYDYANYGDGVELIYECLIIGSGGYNVKFSAQGFPNVKNLTYCMFCSSSADLFGCISLRNKKYCILNKQYTKEEYEELVPRIIEHMKSAGEYGEFFPCSMSPFPYKDTAAHEFFPLEEDEAKAKGFVWFETGKPEHKITMTSSDIPDDIKDVADDMLTQAVECAHKGECKQGCAGAFRVIEFELEYCRTANIPLPRLCTNCRHNDRLGLRNPPRFYRRQCACDYQVYSNFIKHSHHETGRCPNEFETSYSPDCKEIVYCEDCYQAEIA